MCFQKIRVHGNTPLNNKLSLTQSHLRWASESALKLWIKETATVLVLVEFDGFYFFTLRRV
jgi:hypothetical protein